MSGTVDLDATRQPIRGSAALDLAALRLDRLFPQVEAMKRAEGTAHGKIDVNAALLASASGRVTLAVDHGRISNLVLEMLGLDAGEMLLLFGSELQCAVTDLILHGGIVKPEVLVVDTDDTIGVGSGAIDLGKERFDLTLHPEPKDRSILAARAPLHVRGSSHHPQIAPDTASLVARGAGAVLLGLVNPLLAIASFIETGPGKDSDCARLIARAKSWGDKPER